jgi:hypothetical protein
MVIARGSHAKVLAVASTGGHWEELMLIRPALDGFDVEYASTDPELALRDGLGVAYSLPDPNRRRPLVAVRCLWAALKLVRRVRPDYIVTTGSLPGLMCIIAGRTIGCRSVWIDSIAQSEHPSVSGRCAGFFATLWLTQWEHLAKPGGPHYAGSVL